MIRREATRAGMRLGGRFRLLRTLGGGGVAAVWLARDERDGGEVAVKMLHPRLRARKSARARLEREASLLTRLVHPHIARAVALVLDEDAPWFALEFVPGMTLEGRVAEAVEARRKLSFAWITTAFAQLSSALAHAHAAGIVHRDLKPSNVMVGRDPDHPEVRVLDFGLAKVLEDPEHRATTQGRRLGSVAYMSPEQARGEAIDPRTDVFALGVIAFELFTGRRCWALGEDGLPVSAVPGKIPSISENTIPVVLQRIAEGARPRPSAFRTDAPPGLDAWFERAVHPDRNRRFPSVEHLHGAFAGVMGSVGADDLTVATADPTKVAADPTLASTAVVRARGLEPEIVPTTIEGPAPRPPPPRPAPAPSGGWRQVLLGAVLGGAVVGGAMTTLQNRASPVVVETPPPVAPVAPAVAPAPRPAAAARPPSPAVPAAAAPPPRNAPVPEPSPPSTLPPAPRTASLPLEDLAPKRAKSKPSLRPLWRALEQNPDDGATLERLRARLLERAESLPAEQRARVIRLTETSVLTGDLEGLSVAIRVVEAIP